MLGADRIARSFELHTRELEAVREIGWSEWRPCVWGGVTTALLPTVNGAFVWGPGADPEFVRDTLARVADEGYPHSLTVRGAAAPQWHELAAEFGLSAVDDVRVMTLAHPERLTPAGPPQLSLRELGADEASVHYELSDAIFQMPTGTTELMCPPTAFAFPSVRAYAGEADGEMVCTTLTVTAEQVAWIYDVGTLAEHRGCGYGGAITAHAVSEAVRAGATLAVLHTSDDGYPVYRRLGFEHTESWTLWVSEFD